MSKISEYLQLIPDGIRNIDKVAEGIKNSVLLELGTLDEQSLNIIIERRKICAVCPYLSENAKKAGWYTTAREEEHCTMCGCPIKTKTASLASNCGIEVFNANLKPGASPLQLRWIKTNQNG
jgi:hypothetical protein